MSSKMQYLVSLSDEIAEKLIELEKLWNVSRDGAVAAAISVAYETEHPLSDTQMKEYRSKKFSLGEAAQKAASSIAITILKQSLDEGRTIRIPSLGITIEPEKTE